MKYYFELRKDKVTQDSLMPIRVLIKHEKTIIKRNTGESCELRYWNGFRVSPNSKKEKYNNHLEINETLQSLENRINDVFLFFRANKIPFNKETFIEKFESKEVVVSSFDFFTCFDEFIEIGKLSKAYNTTKAQTTCKNFLKEFENDTNYKIEFESLNDRFFEELSRYCFIEREIKNNYFAKIIAVLKTMLRFCIKKGYQNKRDFEDFRATEHDIDIIYLTFDELLKLNNHDFDNDRIINIESVSDEFKFSNRINDNYKIVNNKFSLLPAEIKSRTNCDYIKCYNFYEFRRLGDDYLDCDKDLLLYLEKFFFPRKLRNYEPEYYVTFFILSLDFKLPRLDFMDDYDKKYYLKDFISIFDPHHGIDEELRNEEEKGEENQLKNNVKAIFDNSKYRSLLKLNIKHNQAEKLFNEFVEKALSNDKQLKKDFKDLFAFIVDESINIFPTTNQLTVKDVKYIMRFFSKYKGIEFEYNVNDLQYLLTHFANKPEQYKNSSINKAHREDRFNIDPKIQKELNSLIR